VRGARLEACVACERDDPAQRLGRQPARANFRSGI
jgi:hypothetical protein